MRDRIFKLFLFLNRPSAYLAPSTPNVLSTDPDPIPNRLVRVLLRFVIKPESTGKKVIELVNLFSLFQIALQWIAANHSANATQSTMPCIALFYTLRYIYNNRSPIRIRMCISNIWYLHINFNDSMTDASVHPSIHPLTCTSHRSKQQR